MAPKRTLLRYVAVDAAVVADPAASMAGRGAYTCRTETCLGRARERGGFDRAFRRAVRAPLPQHVAPELTQAARPPAADERRRPAPSIEENVHLRHE